MKKDKFIEKVRTAATEGVSGLRTRDAGFGEKGQTADTGHLKTAARLLGRILGWIILAVLVVMLAVIICDGRNMMPDLLKLLSAESVILLIHTLIRRYCGTDEEK